MRILHITPSYKPAYQYGGPIISVSRLAEEQAKAGAEVWVFATTANGAAELDVPTDDPITIDGVQVRYFRRWTGDHGHLSPALLWAVWREARQFRTVHIHSWWNWVAFGTALVCRLRAVRAVVSPRGMLSPYTLQGKVRRVFQKHLGRWLLGDHLLHATSKQEMWELQKLHPEKKAAVLPNIVYLPRREDVDRWVRDAQDFFQPVGAEAREVPPLKLLFLSRVHPKKGLAILFRALVKWQNAPNWRLVIAGDTGSEHQIKMATLALDLGLADRIHWMGWVQDAAKWALLAQADLLFLPSYNENFAIVVLEALAVGTPVIVGNQVGLQQYVAENNLGWSTAPDPASLRQMLDLAVSNTQKRQRIRQTAPDRVRTDFDPGTVARAYLDLYDSMQTNT